MLDLLVNSEVILEVKALQGIVPIHRSMKLNNFELENPVAGLLFWRTL
jgi:hypothetical protein